MANRFTANLHHRRSLLACLADGNSEAGALYHAGSDRPRSAFGCGESLAATISALARHSAHVRGAMLWPLPGRDETTLLTAGTAQEVA